MCEYTFTQSNNIVKFKNIKKFIENFCIYFEENITCLDLMDKYFPKLNCII